MKIPDSALDINKRIDWEYFLDADTGALRPEIISAYGLPPASEGEPDFLRFAAALKTALPNKVVTQYGHDELGEDGNFNEIKKWLGENTHGGWQLWVHEEKLTFLFATDVDAINFKMAWF